MEVMSVLRPKEQVRRFLLRLAHVETHNIQRAGAFEVYAIEREEAFLYERAAVGDNGVGGRLRDDFYAHAGLYKYTISVFANTPLVFLRILVVTMNRGMGNKLLKVEL